jgi:hypothetical protein
MQASVGVVNSELLMNKGALQGEIVAIPLPREMDNVIGAGA